jgi:fumarate reductase subunit D
MTHEEARVFVKDHLRNRGEKPIKPTESLVRYWWGVLNAAVFYGRLHKPVKVQIKGIRDSFAWAETNTKNKGRVNIRIQRSFPSRLLFLTILLHEMVHAWEHQHHTVMGHAKRFFAWKNRIKWTVGLELKESHNEDDYRYE